MKLDFFWTKLGVWACVTKSFEQVGICMVLRYKEEYVNDPLTNIFKRIESYFLTKLIFFKCNECLIFFWAKLEFLNGIWIYFFEQNMIFLKEIIKQLLCKCKFKYVVQ